MSFGPRLAAAARALSDGDRSVLLAAIERDTMDDGEAVMTSTACSANDRFWALLSNVGLLRGFEAAPTLKITWIPGYAPSPEWRQTLPPLPSLFGR